MALSPVTSPLAPTLQYIRKCTLLVSDAEGNTLDLSPMKIKFQVKQSSAQTPNAANIRVFNLSADTAIKVRSRFVRVLLQAGYESNFGVIFQGNIKQVIIGQESATDTFIDIIAGDGALAYNFAVVNESISADAGGVSQNDQIKACVTSMAALGVTSGANTGVQSAQKLPRGKTLFGNSRNYLRDCADTTQSNWSIQGGQVVFVPLKSYLPGEAVDINSTNGMIGVPQQTNNGVNVKCLINPRIKIYGRIHLDNDSVVLLPVNLTLTPGSATNTAYPLPSNGIYNVIMVEHTGDTRGTDWYSTLICLYVDATSPIQGSVNG